MAVVVTLLAGCFRYGFPGAEDGPGPAPDAPWSHDSTQTDAPLDATRDAVGSEGPSADGGTTVDLDSNVDASETVDAPVAPPVDLAPDGPPVTMTGPLSNPSYDSLNATASGTLQWKTCASTFTGEVVVKDLAPGHVYQLKLDQSWSVDLQTGKNLSSVCRTWDETIWQVGDINNVLPAPYTGAAAGNVSAANVGDYLSTTEQGALHAAGHDLSGYLVFAFFEVLDATTATHTQDNNTPATQVTVQADGFHFPIEADFSWHTSTSVQKGSISLPAGSYNARFLITREGGAWPDPLLLDKVTFTVGNCP